MQSALARPIVHVELKDFKCSCCNSKYTDNEVSDRQSVQTTIVKTQSAGSKTSQSQDVVCLCFKKVCSQSDPSPTVGCSCGFFQMNKICKLLSCISMKCHCRRQK